MSSHVAANRPGSQWGRYQVPLAGTPAESPPIGTLQFRDLVNTAGQVLATRNVTAAGATNATTYDLTINGDEDTTVTYLSDGSASTAEISAGLFLAAQESPAFGSHARVAVVSSTVFSVTGRTPADEVVLTSTQSGGDITIGSLTAMAEADEVYPGRVCMFYSDYGTSGVAEGGMVLSTRLTADVWTLTVTYAASERYHGSFVFEGQRHNFDVLANTDTAQTCTDLAAQINAKMPANTVIAAAGATTVTLTSEKPGSPITDVSVGVITANVTRLTLAHTNTAITADINLCGLGIAARRMDMAAYDTEGVLYYPANDTVQVLAQGTIWVDCASAITPNGPVYVETATGTDQGKLYAAPSSTRILWNKARWQRRNADDSRAIVYVNTLG